MKSLRWAARGMALVGLTFLLLVPMASAWAQTSPYPNPNTPGTVDPCPGKGLPVIGVVNGVAICGTSTQQAQTTSSALAFTGANILLIVGLGFVIAAGGVGLVLLGRRPRTAD